MSGVKANLMANGTMILGVSEDKFLEAVAQMAEATNGDGDYPYADSAAIPSLLGRVAPDLVSGGEMREMFSSRMNKLLTLQQIHAPRTNLPSPAIYLSQARDIRTTLAQFTSRAELTFLSNTNFGGDANNMGSLLGCGVSWINFAMWSNRSADYYDVHTVFEEYGFPMGVVVYADRDPIGACPMPNHVVLTMNICDVTKLYDYWSQVLQPEDTPAGYESVKNIEVPVGSFLWFVLEKSPDEASEKYEEWNKLPDEPDVFNAEILARRRRRRFEERKAAKVLQARANIAQVRAAGFGATAPNEPPQVAPFRPPGMAFPAPAQTRRAVHEFPYADVSDAAKAQFSAHRNPNAAIDAAQIPPRAKDVKHGVETEPNAPADFNRPVDNEEAGQAQLPPMWRFAAVAPPHPKEPSADVKGSRKTGGTRPQLAFQSDQSRLLSEREAMIDLHLAIIRHKETQRNGKRSWWRFTPYVTKTRTPPKFYGYNKRGMWVGCAILVGISTRISNGPLPPKSISESFTFPKGNRWDIAAQQMRLIEVNLLLERIYTPVFDNAIDAMRYAGLVSG